MTFNQEIVMAFLNKEVTEKAKQLYKSDSKVITMELYDATFRLLKSKNNIISFEFALSYAMKPNGNYNIPGIGSGQKSQNIMFFNPVGFFIAKKELFDTKIEATILNQFEKEYNELRNSGDITNNVKVSGLPFIYNAMIGAFSAEASAYILTFEECSFEANGLSYYIAMADDGDSQIFLDRKYRIDGDNCIAIFTNGSLYSNADYSEVYHQLEPMGIFSIQKKIG